MIPACIEGANIRLLGNGTDVGDLYAVRTDDGFVTAWTPTPAELVELNNGAPVYLFVFGQQFPPVALGVKKE
jgi:hypothetical protein